MYVGGSIGLITERECLLSGWSLEVINRLCEAQEGWVIGKDATVAEYLSGTVDW